MNNKIEELKKTMKRAIDGPSWVVDEWFKPLTEAKSIDEWHEDYGDVLWWTFPIEESPYCGSPLDVEWPDYHTHWTPIVIPTAPSPKEGTDWLNEESCARCGRNKPIEGYEWCSECRPDLEAKEGE